VKRTIILNESFALNDRYRVVLYALRIPANKKFPLGIKAKYVLIDVQHGPPRFLVDNHEPYGFHMHTRLPDDETVREPLDVADHDEALDRFFKEVERIIGNEKK
jgi:hypothetical protein